MTVTTMVSAGLEGLVGFPVDLEVDVAPGLPATRIVGLPDAALREARDRVRAALRSSGYPTPQAAVTVNLAPAQRPKENGSAFDLPIALAILAASDPPVLEASALAGAAALGELSLRGSVRGVRGVLAAVRTLAGAGVRRLLVPRENARVAALAAPAGLRVIPVDGLAQAVGILRGLVEPEEVGVGALDEVLEADDGVDLRDVRGQVQAKHALCVAAVGGHNLLLSGPPGTGKTMLARRLPGLLPRLTVEEALEVSTVHAAAQAYGAEGELVVRRPFRAPHHTASYAALVGGGSVPRPGEVSLAHRGVLFLDELPEFAGKALEALREPLELHTITIARAKATHEWPADFLLVAAMNPCPCGLHGHPQRLCRCAPRRIEQYVGRLSGPLLDRIDVHVRVPPVSIDTITGAGTEPGARSSAEVRAEVVRLRALQEARGGAVNARLTSAGLKRVCQPTPEAVRTLHRVARAHGLSGRGITALQRLARTLADMEGRDAVGSDHVHGAVELRVGA